MNAERELELQAYVDGELSAWRVSRVRRQIAKDPEAQRLVAELTMTRRFLAANEVQRSLPDNGEFYWSQIRQAILRGEPVEESAAAAAGLASWRRILAPLAGVAMAVCLAIIGFNWVPSANVEEAIRYVAEVENLSENTDSMSFRSVSENMFVVWVHEKTPVAASDAEYIEDDDFSF